MKRIISTLFTAICLSLFDYNPQAQPSNNTGASNLSPEMKTFYDMTLLDEAQPNLVHAQFAQKRPIPRGKGKTIEFRKFDSLPKAMTPLVEGVTPDGSSLRVTAITATVQQYGDFIVQTDVLELTALDNTILEATKILGRQAGLTLDSIIRDEINTGTNVNYCSSWSGTTEVEVSGRYKLTADNKLTVLEVQKAVTKLRLQNAPTINGDYVAIIHPAVAHDLMRDPEWIEAHKYAQPEELYTGEIGKIRGCRFVQTTEAKIFQDLFKGINGVPVKYDTVKSDASSGATSVTLTGNYPAHYFKGKTLMVGHSTSYVPLYVSDNTAGSSSGTALTVTAITSALSADDKVWSAGSGKEGIAVFSTLFLGADAYGDTEVEGGGLETIIKQKGSGGTSDPLDQRSSIGWKAIKTAKILLPNYIVRVESGSSYSSTLGAN